MKLIHKWLHLLYRFVLPLAHLYDLTDQELVAVRAVADWSKCNFDTANAPTISADALACAVEKVGRDEVIAKAVCLMNYAADAQEKNPACRLKRSQSCSCPCPEVEDFLNGRPFVVCNILAEKVATDQLLTSNTACFNGPVNFATSVCGVPGGMCWEPVLCSEWTESLDVLPTSCLPTCGKVILNSFTATDLTRIAIGYQSKDGVDNKCQLKSFSTTQNMSSFSLNIVLFDVNDQIYPGGNVILSRPTADSNVIANDNDCFIAVEVDNVAGINTGVFNASSCIGLAQVVLT